MSSKKKQPDNKEPISEVESLRKDTSNALALKVLHDSEGGKLLIGGLVIDIIGAIDTMITNNGSLTHIELVMLATRMKERIDLMRTLTGAKANAEVYKQYLEEALAKEAENQEQAP